MQLVFDTKTCTKCRETKSYDDFHLREGGRLRSHCKTCINKQNRDYQMTPERKKKRQEIWRKSSRFIKYGLTEESFNEIITEQQYRCKICNTSIDSSCHVDHCHDTGKVRGLLCHQCNCGLGFFKDSTSRLEKALVYLNETTCL